jgi:tetratricopeptide (TPR) repeat protein
MTSDARSDAYLIKRQSDPKRLRRIAFQEFVAARNSGRMIAFVGSYASKHLGYVSWKAMVKDFLLRNKALAGGSRRIFSELERLTRNEASGFSDIDVMDLAELMADIDKHSSPERYLVARKKFAKGFELKGVDRPNILNAGKALFEHLGLTRFMTLNYDLELEWRVFLSEAERRERRGKRRQAEWNVLPMQRDQRSKRLTRAIPGRGQVTSDIVARDDSAQLIEFALDSPGLHSRILHMHGRVDAFEDLLVTRRDYRDRYWLSGFSKLPFEYGMRLIFAGNPILFVGLGGSEADVMRVLEQFLSDNPNRRAVPMFMLWNSSGSDVQDDARRLLFYRKYGIHILFDKEIVGRTGKATAYERRIAGLGGPKSSGAEPFRLIRPIEHLARIAEQERSGLNWTEDDFRSPQSKYCADGNASTLFRPDGQSYRVDIWNHRRPGLSATASVEAYARSELPGVRGKVDPAAPKLELALSGGRPIRAIIGDPGSGRGAIVDAIARAFEQHYFKEPNGRVVVLNGSFATETDSIFGILSGAFDQRTAQAQNISRARSTGQLATLLREVEKARRMKLLPDGETAPDIIPDDTPRLPFLDEIVSERMIAPADAQNGPLTLIINGMERFVGHDGSSLSNELDMLIRMVIATEGRASGGIGHFKSELPENPGETDDADVVEVGGSGHLLKVILVGTKRLVRYLNVVAPGQYDAIDLGRKDGRSFINLGDHEYALECRNYFEVVSAAVNAVVPGTLTTSPRHRELSATRRSFFARLFDHAFPARIGVSDPELAFELLRTLAYIGQPTEQHVLYHAPQLWQRGRKPTVASRDQTRTEYRAAAKRIDEAVSELKSLGLLLDVDPFPHSKSARIGLHKTVIAELRERYGVPMSDSRLANGFNLSLFAAQPVDTYTPDARWHQEIGKLVDFLIGAHRDGLKPPAELLRAADAVVLRVSTDPDVAKFAIDTSDLRYLAHLATAEVADCLRAALSILRSYYSVPALLMHSNRDLDPWMRDGPLSEHADRLMRLLRVAQQVAEARRLVGAELGRAPHCGPPPFYPDDLVWLNNELATVRLTQGNLYDARLALARAMRLNNEYVERGDRQQNWRRLELNRIQLEIDRGMIERAEDCIRDLESVVEDQAKLFSANLDTGFATARDYIVAQYGGKRGDGRPRRVDPHLPTDLILTIALTQGYRGICQHLRGAMEASERSFATALRMLLNLDEQRAYAFFQRHAAAVKARMSDIDGAAEALRRCISAAGHARQADIDHSGRISLVQYRIAEHGERAAGGAMNAIPQLAETLRYATASDMYRLQIEAMQNLAFVHLRNGDTDSAMRFATDALSIATRCGFGLRKVSLRILLGRILGYRGALDDARELFSNAALIASKLHYEQAVESAENARIELGLATKTLETVQA